MTADQLAQLIAKFPTPSSDGKLAEVDKKATDEAIAAILRGGRDSVVGIVSLLTPDDKGGDSQARHALHALVIHVGGLKDDGQRKVLAEALASMLGGDRPKDVQAFVVRQLQLVGGQEVVPALGALLADEALSDSAAQALLAIRDGATDAFCAALPKTAGRQRLAVIQSLGTLKAAASIEPLSKLVGDKDHETRLMAIWALANIGDAGSSDLLLKAADAEGYERIRATEACLRLAENLLAAGRKKEAARIYSRLSSTRNDPSERHVRAAAERGLATAK